MEVWNFDYLWKNYGTMEEKLWYHGKKLWYYTVNEGFTKRKTWLITKNYESLIYNEKKNMVIYLNNCF